MVEAFSNSVLDTIRERRSTRDYKPDMPEKIYIDKIIQSGLYGASGNNCQSPIIIAITNKEVRDKLARLNARIMGKPEDYDPFYGAPVVLVVLADKSCPTYIYDGSIALANMMLAAYSSGLGSCWIHRAKEEFESEEGKEILASLGIKGDYEGIGHCIVGYPYFKDKLRPLERDSNRVFYI